MGPDGALWFPQVLAGEIWRYDLDTGSLERRVADLATPTAVKFDAEGRLLTSEGGAGRLTRIDLTTGVRETLAQVAPGIDNFAIGDGGRLFVSHFTDGRVAEVTGGVEHVLSGSGLVGPFGLDVAADGGVWSADALAVNRTEGGTPTVVMSLLADLPGMAVDVAHHGDRPLVLLARGQVLRRESDGRMTSVAGHLDGARAMTSAPGGGAYVVEAGSGAGAGRVVLIDGEGGTSREVAHGLTDPRAVAVAPDGTVWVSHPGGATGFRDGQPIGRVDGVAEPQGIAVGADHAVLAEPGRRAVVVVELGSGRAVDAVTNASIGPPVAGARMPHAFSPVTADGDGFLVGCDGDGSIRRLCAA
jgi:streptogramin lyase